MNPAKIELHRDRQGLWRWRIRRSGRIIAESGEGYQRQGKALRTLSNLFSAVKRGLVRPPLIVPTKPRKKR